MSKGGAKRGTRDMNYTRVRRVHLHDQEDRAGNRKRGDQQTDDRDTIARGEKTETKENDREPKNQYDQQRDGNRIDSLFGD